MVLCLSSPPQGMVRVVYAEDGGLPEDPCSASTLFTSPSHEDSLAPSSAPVPTFCGFALWGSFAPCCFLVPQCEAVPQCDSVKRSSHWYQRC
eukprot:NODE_16044_length_316_cov_2.962547_g14878_i0.p3 GENE.NODE_16044_length_316_cov_2.962547_g14878_i0~~NODE_16044_length_316_cov_2.962547_g14878_i0.p3  ORF type:complete len:92 (+),score=4.65 NODE_16044_length_316_cov_2.962547_g14878_i0:1-276(+)